MWLDLTTSHRQTWLFSSTSTHHSTDLLTVRGVAHLVVHGTTGSTSYETIPPVRLESYGGVLSTVDMVVQRRDGPRRLSDHDDDDDDEVPPICSMYPIHGPLACMHMSLCFKRHHGRLGHLCAARECAQHRPRNVEYV